LIWLIYFQTTDSGANYVHKAETQYENTITTVQSDKHT